MLKRMISFHVHQKVGFLTKKRTTRRGEDNFFNPVTGFTEQALKETNYKGEYPKATTENPSRYSDRDRAKTFRSEKDRLEKSMKLGEGKDFYKSELEKMGYQITSVNKDKADYVEYEVVKGSDTYEVQIDFDKAGKAKKVDVAANIWKADATERALKGGSTAAVKK